MVGYLLLVASIGLSAVICHKKLSNQFKDARITFTASAVVWILSAIYASLSFPFSDIVESVSPIIAFSLILVALLMMIRHLKPGIFRYPYITVFMPVVIPFSYYLTYQTSLMKDTILHSVSAMIVVVSLILSLGYKDEIKPFLSIIAGTVLLSVSISGSFFLDEDQYVQLLWYFITSVGITISTYGFVFTFNRNIET